MAHACKPSTLGGRGGWITRSRDRDHPGQHGETPSQLKIHTFSWAWWCAPIVAASWEAEAGELLEPGRQRCSEPRSSHCTPAWVIRAKLRLKKKEKKNSLVEGMVYLLIICFYILSQTFTNEQRCSDHHFKHSQLAR